MQITEQDSFIIIQAPTDEMVIFTKEVDERYRCGWRPVNIETVTDSTGKMFFVGYFVPGRVGIHKMVGPLRPQFRDNLYV